MTSGTGGGAGQVRAQLRRRHERRPGLTCSTRRAISPRSAATGPRVDLEAVPDGGRGHAARPDSSATWRATGSPRGQRVLENWEQMLPKLRQGLPARIQAGAGRPPQPRRPPACPVWRLANRPAGCRGGALMGKVTGFLEYTREIAERRPRRPSASTTGSKSTCRFPSRASQRRPRAAWIAACRSATTAAR